MFSFLNKKKNKKSLVACTDGILMELDNVNDPVFSEKIMGDGFAIKSKGSKFYSPADGVISMLFPSKHAYALTLDDGMEILVHIGINTVAEEGKGFECKLTEGDKVKAGDEVIAIDRGYLEGKGYDLTTMIIFTNKESYKDFSCEFGNEVIGGKDISAYYKA